MCSKLENCIYKMVNGTDTVLTIGEMSKIDDCISKLRLINTDKSVGLAEMLQSFLNKKFSTMMLDRDSDLLLK